MNQAIAIVVIAAGVLLSIALLQGVRELSSGDANPEDAYILEHHPLLVRFGLAACGAVSAIAILGGLWMLDRS